MKYEYNGGWYSTQELADMSGIAPHTLRDRLRRGFSVNEAVKLTPVHDCVKDFCDASLWTDWIGMSTNALYEIFFRWCISNGYEYMPVTKQGFSRQLLSLYPNLKTVPTRYGEKCERIIRERN